MPSQSTIDLPTCSVYKPPVLPIRDHETQKLRKRIHELSMISLLASAYSIGATVYISFLIIYSFETCTSNNSNVLSRKNTTRKSSCETVVISKTDVDEENPCGYGWIYFDDLDQCYYLKNFTNPPETYTYWKGERNCQKMHAHLVSIHSDAEYQFVKELIFVNTGIFVKGKSVCLNENHVWIGLHYINGTTHNIDGTYENYFKYRAESYLDLTYTMCSDRAESDSHYVNYHHKPDEENARYVCKRRRGVTMVE